MWVRRWVLDVVVIFITLALCVLCTGTWYNWRRNFQMFSPKLPKLWLFSAWNLYWKFWISPEIKRAFSVADRGPT